MIVTVTVLTLLCSLPPDFHFQLQQSIDKLEPEHILMDRILKFLSNLFQSCQSEIHEEIILKRNEMKAECLCNNTTLNLLPQN